MRYSGQLTPLLGIAIILVVVSALVLQYVFFSNFSKEAVTIPPQENATPLPEQLPPLPHGGAGSPDDDSATTTTLAPPSRPVQPPGGYSGGEGGSPAPIASPPEPSIFLMGKSLITGMAADASQMIRFLDMAGNDLAVITNDGKLGIGTADPAAKLHVAAGDTGALINPNGISFVTPSIALIAQETIQFSDGSGKLRSIIKAFPNAGLLILSSDELALGSKAGEIMRIAADGNVGVRDTAPPAALSIAGSILTQGGSGDLDGNAFVNVLDINRLTAYLAATDTSLLYLNDSQYAEADIDGDGKVTYDDLGIIIGFFGKTVPLSKEDRSAAEFAIHRTYGAWQPGIFYVNGKLGVGTPNPASDAQIKGYLQIDGTSGAPPADDCNDAAHQGRMKFDPSSDVLYICSGSSGWVSK